MSEQLKLDEDDLGTILAIGNNEQSGRVTNFELKELVRVYREYSSSQARLSEAVKVLEEVIDRLEQIRGEFVVHRFDNGNERYDSTSGASGRIVSYSEDAITTAKAFIATLGEEK